MSSSSSSSLPSVQLVYFGIEGRAEPVRLALKLAHVPFEDKRVAFSEWQSMKDSTPYGQLPVLRIHSDGPYKAQSGAMLRWAGTVNPEFNYLYPTTDPDQLITVEEALGLMEDFQTSWAPNLYVGMRPQRFGHAEGFQKTPEGMEKVKEMRQKWVANELPKYVKYISDKLAANGGTWIASRDKPTIADCLAVPTLRAFSKGHIDHVDPKCLEEYPQIVDYIKRFCALPELDGWYSDGIH